MFAALRTAGAVLKNCQNRPWLLTKTSLSRGLSLISLDRQQELKTLLPDIVTTLTEDDGAPQLSILSEYFSKMMKYAFLHENHDYPLMQLTVASYETLEKPENLTSENIKLAMYLAYVLEIIQQGYTILDDMTDECETRRGRPSWHMQKEVGLNALNDAILLEQFGFKLFKKHFSQQAWYWRGRELIQEYLLRITMGQTLEGISSRERGLPLSEFTMERVDLIANYKDGGAVYVPVTLGLYKTNKHNSKRDKHLELISNKIAIYMQHKDDFEDCFGHRKQIGTDLQIGRCTWVVAKALQLASPAQKEIIDRYFGTRHPDAHDALMRVYKELNLEEAFQEDKRDFLEDLQKEVLKIADDETLQNLFVKFSNVFG